MNPSVNESWLGKETSGDRPQHRGTESVCFLRDQGKPQAEWLDAIAADQTFSEPVRQRALQFARDWKSPCGSATSDQSGSPTSREIDRHGPIRIVRIAWFTTDEQWFGTGG